MTWFDFGDSLWITLDDLSFLNCSICSESMRIPVYQCENLHMACSSCCSKVGKECPSCHSPISKRDRRMEELLEIIEVRCRNNKYGCENTMSYIKMSEHEKKCRFAPSSCPLPDCNHVGAGFLLCRHFHISHPNSATIFQFDNSVPVTLNASDKCLILQEREGLQLFILENSTDHPGNSVSLSCVSGAGKREYFYYDILVTSGESTCRFQSRKKNIQKPEDNPTSMEFNIIPSKFSDADGQLKLDICIRGRSSPPPTLKIKN